MTPEIEEKIRKHALWLANEDGGERADLSGADLSEADLSEADLSGADLSGADLRWAYLRWANLSGADLSDAEIIAAVGQFGLHQAIAAGGYISIGCERHDYQHWLDHYEEIGRGYGYTEAEIARYGAWIKLVVDWLTEAEGNNGHAATS
jgi:hypothetical protein